MEPRATPDLLGDNIYLSVIANDIHKAISNNMGVVEFRSKSYNDPNVQLRFPKAIFDGELQENQSFPIYEIYWTKEKHELYTALDNGKAFVAGETKRHFYMYESDMTPEQIHRVFSHKDMVFHKKTESAKIFKLTYLPEVERGRGNWKVGGPSFKTKEIPYAEIFVYLLKDDATIFDFPAELSDIFKNTNPRDLPYMTCVCEGTHYIGGGARDKDSFLYMSHASQILIDTGKHEGSIFLCAWATILGSNEYRVGRNLILGRFASIFYFSTGDNVILGRSIYAKRNYHGFMYNIGDSTYLFNDDNNYKFLAGSVGSYQDLKPRLASIAVDSNLRDFLDAVEAERQSMAIK